MKLRGKKVVCLLMTLILSFMFCCASVSAAEVDVQENLIVARATGSFNMSLSGHTLKKASTSFPLESGEVVKSFHLEIEGIGCKNLLHKDKQGSYILVNLQEDKKADFKKLKTITGKTLSFAPTEELKQILNLEKGSVTPMGLMYDKEGKVFVLLDEDLKEKQVLFHPNVNNKTISLTMNDLIRFIEYTNHSYMWLANDQV